jgi:uncharacterized protein
MNKQTFLKAIDFLHAHSDQSEKRSLSFYGGEPLLEFDLIQRCVDYARNKFSGNCPRFNVTTNGVLLDRNMAEYFARHRFGVTVSVDGPRSVHDRHRVDFHGKGLTPPYDLDILQKLWEEHPWLPRDISIQPNYVDTEFTDFLEKYDCDPSESVYHRSRKRAFSTFRGECIGGTPRKTPLVFSFIEPAMLKVYNRRVYNPPRTFYPLNGCCIPGNRRVFVSHDGKLWLCEKADGCPWRGSVVSG